MNFLQKIYRLYSFFTDLNTSKHMQKLALIHNAVGTLDDEIPDLKWTEMTLVHSFLIIN